MTEPSSNPPKSTAISLGNLAASLLLGLIVVVVFLWPEWLAGLHLNQLQGQCLIMALITLNLALAAANPRVSPAMRGLGLMGALLTAIETILMLKG